MPNFSTNFEYCHSQDRKTSAAIAAVMAKKLGQSVLAFTRRGIKSRLTPPKRMANAIPTAKMLIGA
jgi:hypothetical protein